MHRLEQATGQHRWADRVLGDPMMLDYMSATKTLNFVSRSLAVETMRVKEHLLTFAFVVKEIDVLASLGTGNVRESGEKLKEIVSYHVNTCENFLLRAEFQEKKVHALIAVVSPSSPAHNHDEDLMSVVCIGIPVHDTEGFESQY
jgi:hypothetical protein